MSLRRRHSVSGSGHINKVITLNLFSIKRISSSVAVMALKSLLLVGLVVAATALQMAEAQLPGGDPNSLSFDLLGIQVTLYCTPDGNRGFFGLSAPPFKGANVQLQCGNNAIIANATTNSYGIGYVVTDPVPVFPFFPPQSNCKLVVNTTLSNCNSTLPAIGALESALGFVGTYILGGLKVANFAPTGFRYNPSL